MVQSTMMAVSWMNPGPMAINLAYDDITQKCWCLVRSPCLRNFLPQAQLSVLNSDCLLAEQVFHHLDVEISLHHLNKDETTPSCPGTTHTIYHTPIACKSTFRTSLHLFFAPWHGLFMLSSPNNNLFGSLSSSMRPT